MFEKLLSKFKKDKKASKGKKAPKGNKEAPAKAVADEAVAEEAAATTASDSNDVAVEPSAAAAAADPEPAPTNGNGKPRVDVIDAMGNSVADMVTNIAQQLTASTEQLSKSRRYTNFAFILLGVTLLTTLVFITLVTLQLSSRLTQVDETLSLLTEQAGDQDNSNVLIEEIRGEVTALLEGQAQLTVSSAASSSAGSGVDSAQFRRLSQSLEALLQNQAATDARLASLGESLKNVDGSGNEKVQALLEDLEQKVGDLYLIEQARIARELQRLREEAVSE